jgi:hypothetical protein
MLCILFLFSLPSVAELVYNIYIYPKTKDLILDPRFVIDPQERQKIIKELNRLSKSIDQFITD